MIRIYSDKIFQLQEQRAKLIGSTFYTLGATKKSGKTAYDELQIKIAAAEIEAELLVKTKGEINAEFPGTDDELFRGADPGFYLGGGALVSCSTSTPINHIVFFFFAEYQLY